jgi:hypothetical protein
MRRRTRVSEAEVQALRDERDSLEKACEALAILVREEYPRDMPLSSIAFTWGHHMTPQHLDALEAFDFKEEE